MEKPGCTGRHGETERERERERRFHPPRGWEGRVLPRWRGPRGWERRVQLRWQWPRRRDGKGHPPRPCPCRRWGTPPKQSSDSWGERGRSSHSWGTADNPAVTGGNYGSPDDLYENNYYGHSWQGGRSDEANEARAERDWLRGWGDSTGHNDSSKGWHAADDWYAVDDTHRHNDNHGGGWSGSDRSWSEGNRPYWGSVKWTGPGHDRGHGGGKIQATKLDSTGSGFGQVQ